MITYELAKELKEAGFKQGVGVYTNNDLTKPFASCGFAEGAVYVPTLSELIEACGEQFSGLILIPESLCLKRGYRWRMQYISGHWKTPEEAIARLWLVLNKK